MEMNLKQLKKCVSVSRRHGYVLIDVTIRVNGEVYTGRSGDTAAYERILAAKELKDDEIMYGYTLEQAYRSMYLRCSRSSPSGERAKFNTCHMKSTGSTYWYIAGVKYKTRDIAIRAVRDMPLSERKRLSGSELLHYVGGKIHSRTPLRIDKKGFVIMGVTVVSE